MRVVLVAMTARGTMSHYLDELVPELAKHVDLRLVAPAHYTPPPGVDAIGFEAPAARARRAFALADPRGGFALWDRISPAGADVVHLFNGIGFPWAAAIARRARANNLPVLVTMHDPQRHPGDVWSIVNTPARRVTLRSATAFHVHAELWTEVVLQRGLAPVFVVPHGSFAPRFLRHRADGIEREPLALFFGRIERYKGVDDLVDAAVRHPFGMRTAIAGGGTLSRHVRAAIARHASLFEMHAGYQPDEVIARLLQRARVCVLPYRQATQSSIPLIAAGFGVPVVATSTGAFVEDVPRVGGVLAPPRDPSSLSQGIVRAAASTARYPHDLEFRALAPRFAEMYAQAAT